jgi:hypothetical protein
MDAHSGVLHQGSLNVTKDGRVVNRRGKALGQRDVVAGRVTNDAVQTRPFLQHGVRGMRNVRDETLQVQSGAIHPAQVIVPFYFAIAQRGRQTSTFGTDGPTQGGGVRHVRVSTIAVAALSPSQLLRFPGRFPSRLVGFLVGLVQCSLAV